MKSLKYCPSQVVNLSFCHNQVTSLKYCPEFLESIEFEDNNITSLRRLDKNKNIIPWNLELLDCNYNYIKSLKYCYKIECLDCEGNQMTSFKYLPILKSYNRPRTYYVWLNKNPLNKKWHRKISVLQTDITGDIIETEKIYDYMQNTYLNNFRNILNIMKQIKIFKKLNLLWSNYWYDTYFHFEEFKVNRLCLFSIENL